MKQAWYVFIKKEMDLSELAREPLVSHRTKTTKTSTGEGQL